MERIRSLAKLSVLRACGFACLAIGVAMAGLAFDPAFAFRLGAVLMLILAAVLEARGRSYHRVRRITETEVWILLEDHERPSKEVARPLIVAAMEAELREKAGWALALALGFFCVALVVRWLG